MTQAAGIQYTACAEEPALVVECPNGYRTKERMPSNLGEFTVPLALVRVVKPDHCGVRIHV